MQDQSLFSLERQKVSSVQGRNTIFHRMTQIWLRLSGPDVSRFSNSLEDQQRLRRSRSLSMIFPLFIVAVLIEAPNAVLDLTYWAPVITLLALGLVAFFLNRAALINLSGLFTILAIDAALVVLLLTLPHGIKNGDVTDFDIFILPILIAGITLPRRLLPFLALIHIALIFALFITLPHDPLLTEEILLNDKGIRYLVISDAIVLQVVGTLIAWVGAWNVDKALARANKAEELVQAQWNLNEQARFQVEQKKRLEYGIEVLKDAHARFANGDYRARANLQDNELVSLAFSFNLLAERMNRVAQAAQAYAQLEQAFQQLFTIQTSVVYGGALQPLMPTGTLVDRIYPWLKQYYQLRQMYAQCLAAVEQMRQTLTHQRTLLMQLTSALDQTHADVRLAEVGSGPVSLSLGPVEKAQHLCKLAEEQEKLCLQQTKQLDQMLKV